MSYEGVSPSGSSGLGRRVEAPNGKQRRQATALPPLACCFSSSASLPRPPRVSSLHLCVLIFVPRADCGRPHKLERGMGGGQYQRPVEIWIKKVSHRGTEARRKRIRNSKRRVKNRTLRGRREECGTQTVFQSRGCSTRPWQHSVSPGIPFQGLRFG
jgi:hypothetical protein